MRSLKHILYGNAQSDDQMSEDIFNLDHQGENASANENLGNDDKKLRSQKVFPKIVLDS